MSQGALHPRGCHLAGLDDRELAARGGLDRGPQPRERRGGERERPDTGCDQLGNARAGRVLVERPLLHVDRRGTALPAQRLPERARAHAAGDDDGRHCATAAGGAGLRNRRLEADQRDLSRRLRRQRVEHALRRGQHKELGAVSAQLGEQVRDALHDDGRTPARVGRVGVVAQQQQILPGQQLLQGAGDRDPVGILGQDAHGAVGAQTRGRFFSGS